MKRNHSASPAHYRAILQRHFDERMLRNPRYSLRAYARDLGVSPTSLSLILNQKQGLSRKLALRFASELGLSAGETERFIDLVLIEHSRSKKEREIARLRLRKHEGADSNLALDVFQVMSDWYHFAILELTEIEGFVSDPAWIARALGVPLLTVRSAIERLKKLELLEEKDGRLKQTRGFMATPSGVPSEAIKKFHTQMLKKAEEALYCQSVDERDFSSVVLPIDTADLPKAKARLKEFRRSLCEELEASPRRNRVYCLSLQLFDLQASALPAESEPIHSN